MNYLKRIVLVVIIFLILSFLLSLFLPSSLKLEKSVIIDNDESIIKKQVEKFQITNIMGYQVKDSIQWNYIENEKGIELTGLVDLNYGFNPLIKFSAIFDKEKIQGTYQKNLDSLKLYIENLPKIHRVQVEKKSLQNPIWYLSIRDTVSPFEMNNIHGKLYEKINQYINSNNITTEGSPLVIYHFFSDSIIDLEAGIPIKDSLVVEDDNIKLKKIREGNVVTAIHYGPYDRLPETYFGINEWMRKNKVIVTGPPWEVYLTNPTEEENPDNWKTGIFFPIE